MWKKSVFQEGDGNPAGKQDGLPQEAVQQAQGEAGQLPAAVLQPLPALRHLLPHLPQQADKCCNNICLFLLLFLAILLFYFLHYSIFYRNTFYTYTRTVRTDSTPFPNPR